MALAFYVTALADNLLVPARAESAALPLAGDFLPSFMLGIGTEDTAATWICSRNFLKSLSPIFLPEDFCSSFIYSFDYRFFSGVVGAIGFFVTTVLTFAEASFEGADFTGYSYLTATADLVDAADFLVTDLAALVALRPVEATDFAAELFRDLTILERADLAERGAALPLEFFADVLTTFLPPVALLLLLLAELLTVLTVIEEASFSLLTLRVFCVLTWTGSFFLVMSYCSKSSIAIALRLYLASSTSLLIASLGLSVFSYAAISSMPIMSGFVLLFIVNEYFVKIVS